MPSHNILLGSGSAPEEPRIEHNHGGTPEIAMRFSADFPKGKLFKTKEEIVKAESQGWVDHPAKVSRLPGWEKFYDDYKASLIKKDTPETDSVDTTHTLTPEQIEDAAKADALLKANRDLEAKLAKEAEGPELFKCDFEGCTYETEKAQALRMHKYSAHKIKKESE
jgi:hypothetical protein